MIVKYNISTNSTYKDAIMRKLLLPLALIIASLTLTSCGWYAADCGGGCCGSSCAVAYTPPVVNSCTSGCGAAYVPATTSCCSSTPACSTCGYGGYGYAYGGWY